MKNPDRPVAWGKSSISLFMACFSSTKNNQKEDAESVKKSKFIFQVRGGMLEKAQPSLWVMLASFKAHENLKVLEGKHMLAREEDALRQHYPSESVCDGSFLEYLEGLVNTHAHTHTESFLQNLRGKTDLPFFQECKKHVALLQPSPTSLSYFFTRSCPWEIEKRKGLCSQAVEILNLELELIFHPASTNKIHQKAMLARIECSVFWGV